MIDDICYKRQLNAAKKKFEREIYGEYFVNTRAREAGAMIRDKRSFLSHPQRMNSNSDSSGSNSPRKVSAASNISTPLQEVEYIYQNEVSAVKVNLRQIFVLDVEKKLEPLSVRRLFRNARIFF